tara:strand:+ start:639 stop:986 length:348 start_codon:yes stop_codon:yes gene_type:complete
MQLKMVVLVREDLKMSPGKLAAQVAHAAVDCALKCDRGLLADWMSVGAKKVVLQVKDSVELHKFQNEAREAGLKNYLVTDAGRTELPEGTETCLGLGPDTEEKIDSVTGKLKMLE